MVQDISSEAKNSESEGGNKAFIPPDAPLRLPLPFAGIQVNHCKMPECAQYKLPAPIDTPLFAINLISSVPYLIRPGVAGNLLLYCCDCSTTSPIKSNEGIAQEVARMSNFLTKCPQKTCPKATCANHVIPIPNSRHYQKDGKTGAGTQKYRCKLCKTQIIGTGKARGRQRVPKFNRRVFSLIINKTPFSGILRHLEIAPKTLYQRIDFIHRQCLAFVAPREALLKTLPIKRLYLGVDSQWYSVNWPSELNQKNTLLKAVCSTDNPTGYVFGMHVNLDSSLDADEVERDALAIGDALKPKPSRKYARLWLKADYEEGIARNKTPRRQQEGLLERVQARYDASLERDDIEATDQCGPDEGLPARGMEIHLEYTFYGHFLFLKRLIGNVEKWRFFLDQDSGMRAACLAAFQPEISARTADAMFVRIKKDYTKIKKLQKVEAGKTLLRNYLVANPNASEKEARLALLKATIAGAKPIGKWADRWVEHPLPTMGEPAKAVCFLTDRIDDSFANDPDHYARLLNKASLHCTDSFFAQIRARLAMLSRSYRSSSNVGLSWTPYAAYSPERIAKLLEIMRVVHNYVEVPERIRVGNRKIKNEDQRTPAMKLGLAKSPFTLEDILYQRAPNGT